MATFPHILSGVLLTSFLWFVSVSLSLNVKIEYTYYFNCQIIALSMDWITAPINAE